VWVDSGKVTLVERDAPSGDGTLVTITSSGICGSDLHLLSLGFGGVILGHEFGGITDDGRLVAVRPTGECGACRECSRNLPHLCADASRDLLGVSSDGGLAEQIRVGESRLVVMPAGVDPTHVALVEPLAVVVHGVERANPAPGSRAIVVGAGSIGLLCAAALRWRGVEVDIVARHRHQKMAADRLGARPVDAPQGDYDASFDAVCSQSAFDMCVAATMPRGALVEFGMFWEPVTLSNSLLMKEITLLPSIFYGHDSTRSDFATAAQVLADLPYLAEAVVTHRFALDDAPEAVRVANERSSGTIKVHLFS
jgi:threonine dehydrogenase-like Zn-dependent dehydrogenase